MTTLTDIEWESPVLEPSRDPALERWVRQAIGMVPPLVPYYYACPWIVRSMVGLESAYIGLQHIDEDLAKLIDLVVSQDNSCRYCYAASRAFLKMLGMREKDIQRLEHGLSGAEVSPRRRTALDFARRLSRANPLPSSADLQPLLDAGYGAAAIREIVFEAAAVVYYNRLATLPAVPTAEVERLDRALSFPVLRSVLGRWLTIKRRATAPPGAPDDGPFAYLVSALAGSPTAAAVGETLHDAWTAPGLPQRTKAFVFAVVARGLACPLTEREATRLLVAEGVDRADVETTLAHLASPVLDALETAVVPFARDTIWYQPAQIQRRARALAAATSREAFLDLVGTAALANAVCRMSVALLTH